MLVVTPRRLWNHPLGVMSRELQYTDSLKMASVDAETCRGTNLCVIWCKRSSAKKVVNHLPPNGHYMGRTAQLTSRCCILYIYSTNIRTEYFKHAA